MNRLYWSLLAVVTLGLLCVPASAGPISFACAADFSSCGIPENVLGQFPFAAISGDVIVTEADGVTVSDVFRIFNDLVDTGGGTGLGTEAFLYSSDNSTPLPDPSTYSSNAAFILEGPNGITDFNGNGTDYILGVPEPATFGMLGLALVAGGIFRNRQRTRSSPNASAASTTPETK